MSRDPARPPWLGRLLLRVYPLGRRRSEVTADLFEAFRGRVAERGNPYASIRYLHDVLSLWVRPWLFVDAARQRSSALDEMILDVQFAVRVFRRQPTVASVTVAGLTLVIGVCAASLGLLEAVGLRPFGGPYSSSVIRVERVSPSGASGYFWWQDDYERLRQGAQLVALESFIREELPYGEAGNERLPVGQVSGDFFRTFGIRPVLGRLLSPDDRTAHRAVVHHDFWKHRLGADPTVVGGQVVLNGTAFEVVGVVESGFTGPEFASPTFLVPPLGVDDPMWRKGAPERHTVIVVGRLAAGVSREQAEAEVEGLFSGLVADRPDPDAEDAARARLVFVDERQEQDVAFGRVVAAVSLILALVMLLGCTNVANALLAGALSRRREVGVRLALGASRGRLVRQMLTESLLLSAVGGAAGMVLARWTMPFLAATMRFPMYAVDPTPGWRVAAIVVGSTVLIGVAAGLAPATLGVRGDVLGALTGSPSKRGRRGGARRARASLVGAQVVASIVLLMLAALMTRALLRISNYDPGYAVNQLLTVEATLAAGGYDPEEAAEFWDRARERVVALPAVQAAALTDLVPFRMHGRREAFRTGGGSSLAYFRETSAGYFAAADVQLLAGRSYTEDESRQEARVAVISERLAIALWPDNSPLGKTLAALDDDLGGVTVIGVVEETLASAADPDAAEVYQPLRRAGLSRARLLVRTRTDPAIAAPLIVDAVSDLDSNVVVSTSLTRADLESQLLLPRMTATMAGLLGAVALVLAFTGVFGLTAFSVAQRTGEIGVRMAVGARRADVIRLMLRDNLRPVVVGIGIGIGLAFAGARVLSAILYGVDPHDPLSIFVAASTLLAAAGLAAGVPSRRAARLDPAKVLRAN